MVEECWFEILHPKAGIRSVVVGKDALGFKIDIYGDDPNEHFEGADQIQDRVSHVMTTLHQHVGPDATWVDFDTREPITSWDAIAALSRLEDW